MTIADRIRSSTLRRGGRQIGLLSTAARVIVGTGLLVIALVDGVTPIDAVLGFGGANAVVFVALAARGADAAPLRFTGAAGHLLNIGLIVAFYALNTTAASLFYGPAMLLAAARGYAACEMFAVWNWVRHRDDQFGCPFFLPIDVLDQQPSTRTP